MRILIGLNFDGMDGTDGMNGYYDRVGEVREALGGKLVEGRHDNPYIHTGTKWVTAHLADGVTDDEITVALKPFVDEIVEQWTPTSRISRRQIYLAPGLTSEVR